MRKAVFILSLILIILPIYFNIISAESINQSVNESYLTINLISWPEDGGELYYNYTYEENETEDELPYLYNFTNSSDVDTCILYIDKLKDIPIF